MLRDTIRVVGAKLAPVWAKTKAVAMSAALAASMTLPAFATGNESSGGGDLSTVVSATDTIVTMVGQAWSLMTSNPLTRVSLAAGLLSMGIGFLSLARRAARGH